METLQGKEGEGISEIEISWLTITSWENKKEKVRDAPEKFLVKRLAHPHAFIKVLELQLGRKFLQNIAR